MGRTRTPQPRSAGRNVGEHPSERLYVRLDGDPLYTPETSVPVDTMVELPVSPALRTHVAHVTAYREAVPEGFEIHERVLPDGAARIMFNLDDSVSAGGAVGPSVVVAGASAKHVSLRLRGRLAGVTVTLRPGAVADVLGVAAKDISERLVPLDDLWRGAGAPLLEQVVNAPDDLARVSLVCSALERRLQDDLDRRRPAQRAAQLLLDSGGRRSVADVADALGIGERRLQQHFGVQVGLTPRAFRRLARLHACVRALRRLDSPRWAQVAVDAGFYDQAHLANEFKALTGMTPAAFFRRTVSGSSNTAT